MRLSGKGVPDAGALGQNSMPHSIPFVCAPGFPRRFAGLSTGIAVGVSVFHIKYNDKFIPVLNGFTHVNFPPFSDTVPGSDDNNLTGMRLAGAGSGGPGTILPKWQAIPLFVFHNKSAGRR